ncbi:MAG: hypothetical protein ABIS26_01770 [Candidatus Paceibacterota bacterium]
MEEKPKNLEKEIVQGRRRKDRLNDIMKLVAEAPNVANPEEAYDIIRDAFLKVEEKVTEPMYLGQYFNMLIVDEDTHRFRYQCYVGHLLILGENGSIEIRVLDPKEKSLDQLAFFNDPSLINKLTVPIFSKNGADGKNVWQSLR